MEIIMGAVVNLVKKVAGAATGAKAPTPAAPPEEEDIAPAIGGVLSQAATGAKPTESLSPIGPPTSGPSILPRPGDVLTKSEGGLPKWDKPGGSDPITAEQIAENRKKGAGYADLSKPDDYVLDTSTQTKSEPITPKEPVRQADPGAVGTGQFKKKRRTKTKTILTGASGVLGQAPIQKKTLLGS